MVIAPFENLASTIKSKPTVRMKHRMLCLETRLNSVSNVMFYMDSDLVPRCESNPLKNMDPDPNSSSNLAKDYVSDNYRDDPNHVSI